MTNILEKFGKLYDQIQTIMFVEKSKWRSIQRPVKVFLIMVHLITNKLLEPFMLRVQHSF